MKKYQKAIVGWDLKSIPSRTYFTATIGRTPVKGLTQRDGSSLFLCFNEPIRHQSDDRLGFEYSKEIFRSSRFLTDADLKRDYSISDLAFPPQPKSFVVPVVFPNFAGWRPLIRSGHVRFGCQRVNNDKILALVKALRPRTSTATEAKKFGTLCGKDVYIYNGSIVIFGTWGSKATIPNRNIQLLAKNLKP